LVLRDVNIWGTGNSVLVVSYWTWGRGRRQLEQGLIKTKASRASPPARTKSGRYSAEAEAKNTLKAYIKPHAFAEGEGLGAQIRKAYLVNE